MKKTFKFFAAALAIVAAASCAKEINVDTPADDSAENVEMTFTASYDAEGETKTVLAENNFIHWTDEDAIGVYVKDNYGSLSLSSPFAIDPSSNDDDPTFAAFTGNLSYNSSNTYYAVAPASGWSSSQMRYSGLAVQNAVKGTFDPSKHIALADKARKDTYDHFVFHNACALLKFTLASDNVYSVKVEGANSNGVGIGGQIQFFTSDIDSKTYAIGQMSNGSAAHITLANSNSTPLEKGATYYIVVPHITVKNFKVSLCDANGNTLVTKSKASDFKIERNKIYPLGTLEVPNESIEVSTTSLSVAASNGSASFNVVANADWTVTTSADWLSVSPSSGVATNGTTVTVTAADNSNTSSRTATITVKGQFVTKTISVTQAKCKTYKVGTRIDQASQIQGGKKYIIRLKSSQAYVWTNTNDKLVLTNNSSALYTDENVFKFYATGTPSGVSGYNSQITGRLQSVKTAKLIDANLNIAVTEGNLSNALTFNFANRWGSETGYDIDIYKNGTSTTLRGYTSSLSFVWSNDGGDNDSRKWAIYEAVEN